MPANREGLSPVVEKKLRNGRTFRDMEMRALQSEEYVVEGYATTFNKPYTLYEEPGWKLLEQVDARAFDGCDMSDVIMQYDHEGRVFARLSNETLELTIDEHGLKIRATLGGTEIGRQLYEEIKGGYTTKMSFSFRMTESRREIIENKETGETTVTRTITKISKIYDVSAVSLPANDATEISARSDGEGVIAEVKQEMQQAEEQRRTAEVIKAKIKIMAEL